MRSQPFFFVLAGPNGAGKSTAAFSLLPGGLHFVNADDIAKTLPGFPSPATDLAAGRLFLKAIENLESRQASFAIETTLASRTLVQRVSRLREAGYRFELYFLWTPDPEFSIRRVAQRVLEGGHDVPEATIRRRHAAGPLNLFRSYIPVADLWRIYENTGLAGARLVVEGNAGTLGNIHTPMVWGLLCEKVNDAKNLPSLQFVDRDETRD